MFLLFLLLSLISIASAICVVAFKNPIHSAIALIVNLLMVAGFFAMLEAHFLAAVQIIVYAGAIMVLVLFMLMLLNIKIEKRTVQENVFTAVAVVFGLLFLLVFVPMANSAFEVFKTNTTALEGTVQAMGIELFKNYVFLFQASGVLLMTAIVGAVMIARKSGKTPALPERVVLGEAAISK